MSDTESKNERLTEQLAQKTAEFRLLQRVSSEINTTLELDAIFRIVLDTMDELFGFEHSLILLLDESGEHLRVAASRGYDDPAIDRRVPLGTGVLGVVAKKRKMMLISNLSQRRAYASTSRRQLEQAGRDEPAGEAPQLPGLPDVESQIAIPLLVKDTLIGVFSVESNKPRIFTERDEVLITIVANQAASAMQTAGLYQAEAQRRRELAEAHEELRKLADNLEVRVRDRTQELEETNRDLKQTQAQLVQSAKMASIGTLASGVAHEINTPIASISSSRDTLSEAIREVKATLKTDEGGKNPKLQSFLDVIDECLGVIGSGTGRVANYVNRLRNFTRLDQADLQQVDIHDGIRDAIGLIEHELRDAVTIRTDFTDLPKLDCYPGRLNQVFLDILMNARQAIEGSGEIHIKTSKLGNRILVTITDNGMGIDAETLPCLFDTGFTTKDRRVGTSLGLPIASQIIKDHRGEIRVESELGRGSMFTLVLPLNLRELMDS